MNLPLVITHVETTCVPISDDAALPTIHAELNRKALLPAEHLVVDHLTRGSDDGVCDVT